MFSKVFGRVFDFNFGKVFKPVQVQDDPVPDFLVKYALDFTDRNMTYFPSMPTAANDMDYFSSAPACNDAIGGRFNGSRSNTVPDGDKWSTGSGAFSPSFWVNSFLVNSAEDLIKVGDETTLSGYKIQALPTGIRVITNNTNFDIVGNWDDGKNHLITLNFKGANDDVDFYVDTILQNSILLPNINISTVSDIIIGATFNGVMDDIRLYGRLQTSQGMTDLFAFTCDFNPSQITTSLHLDAQDQTTITESLGSVSQWDDKSGNGNHLVQGTGSLQGTINGDTMEYVNGQRFDQSNLVNMLDSSGQFTTIFVHDIIDPATSTKGFPLVIDLQDDEPGTGVEKRRPGFLYVQSNGALAMHASGSIAADSNPPLGTSIVGGTGDGSNIRIDINGETMATAGYTPRTFTTLQNFRLGDISIQNLTMKFKEVIHIAGPFNQDIYEKLEGYLAWKWELVGSLPSTHKYRNQPPKSFSVANWDDAENYTDSEDWKD